jgi:methionyl-tRNA synthetase
MPTPGTFDDYDNETLANIAVIVKNVETALEHFKFREAIKEAMNLARLGNKYLADTEPWKLIKTDKEKTGTILYVALQIAANLAILMEPFLPFSSNKLRKMLNMGEADWNLCGQKEILKPGHAVEKPQLLFDKIEDDAIQKQLDRLEEIKRLNEAAAKQSMPSKPVKPNINYDQFAAMDIRIGTILEAEKVPKTDKLLKLKIDTGIDKRTIVSGIAEHYKPEDIIGKQVSILVNLEPRKLRGIESQGMILCAKDSDDKLVFVIPSEKISNGSEVS